MGLFVYVLLNYGTNLISTIRNVNEINTYEFLRVTGIANNNTKIIPLNH